MRLLHLRWYIWLLPVIALVAGYATGHKQAQARKATLTVPGSSLTLEYPADWDRAAPPPALSALRLQQAVTLAPRGNASGGGLLAAPLAGVEDPLPQAVLERLAGSPEGEAISLISSPAFRYRHVSMLGSSLTLTAYAIPTGTGRFTLAMCFAPGGAAATLSTCEAVVEEGQLADEDSSAPVELKPRPSYATALGAALAALDQARVWARAAMAAARSDAELSRQATGLADAFASAQASVAKLSPPTVAAHAAAELEHAMLNARLAYEALAGDAAGQRRSAFALARGNIGQVEAAVRGALEGFALLGYHVS